MLLLGLASFALTLIAAGHASSVRALSLQSEGFQMSGANAKTRLTVHCPGRQLPYSGGMFGDPPGSDGAGFYPHSYERLGVQRGWHVTPVLLGSGVGGSVTLQVLCGPRLGPVSSPHSTVFVRSGESGTAVATCPRGNRVFAGGFQRTNFINEGGDYVTESRASGDRAWQVSGSAFGRFGGELTAIAYCLRSGGPLVSEISSVTPMAQLRSGTATTPACPPGSNLVAGGFTTSPLGSSMIASAYFDPQGGWSTTAFNRFAPAAGVGSLAYCMTAATINRRARMRHGTRDPDERSIEAPPLLDSALKEAISARVASNGCYPAPRELVTRLRMHGITAQEAGSPRGADRGGVVYVLSDGASCERVRFALRRSDGVVLLDSASGEVTLLRN